MSNRRGLSDLIKEEADKPAAAGAAAEPETVSNNADLAEKDKTIAKLEKELEKAKSDLAEAQKEVLRLIEENKQAKAQSQSGGSAKAIAASKAPSGGQMVAASGLQIAHAHKRDNVIIPDMVVNQNAENNPDFAVNTWLL